MAQIIVIADAFTSGPTVAWEHSVWTGSALAVAPEVLLTDEFFASTESLGDKRARSRRALAEAVSRARQQQPRPPKQGRHGFAQACRLPCYRGVRSR